MVERLLYYLMSSPPHLPYLVASLRALRRHYMGPCRVYAYPESYPQVVEIGKDERLCIIPCLWEPVYRGKNGQGLNRIILAQTLKNDAEVVAYLDADTLPNGNLDGLFAAAAAAGYAATQFCDWVTNSRQPRNRVGWMVGRGTIDQAAVQYALTHPLPSVNCGVFAARPGSPVLPVWERWCSEVMDLFIADEVTQHAVTARDALSGAGEVAVLDGRWNCSSSYKARGLPDSEVKVWHFHGDSNVRQNKSPRGVQLWWTEYEKCLMENLGGVARWQRECGNKYLNVLLDQPDEICLYCGKDTNLEPHAPSCPDRG